MNFEFIEKFYDFKDLYKNCKTAEMICLQNYEVCVSTVRMCNEYMIKFIYQAKVGDYGTLTVFDMLEDENFKDALNDSIILDKMHFLRMLGNKALHGAPITKVDALDALETLHFLVGEFFISLGKIEDYDPFISPEDFKQLDIKPAPPVTPIPDPVKEDVTKYARGMKFTRFALRNDDSYKDNTMKYVHACLSDVGYKIAAKENILSPGNVSLNFQIDQNHICDSIITGLDSKPLAIIDYTECKKDLIAGKQKMIENANLLEKRYGVKPVIYYSTGYTIFCIDDLWDKPRKVFAIHTIKELEAIVLRRKTRTPITNPIINQNIVNRPYQQEAINTICNVFTSGRRKSLIVLATGTGKTRVSVALSEILLKNNWVEHILFLADRTSLVHQAKRVFEKLLPNQTTSVFSGDSLDRDKNAKIILSTYQTMITMINGENKEFTPGHFDLLIIDEAHRSIFAKYGFIFKYFDSMLLGLTATPRGDQTKSTYKVFEIDSNEPDYDYELMQAVEEGYLVGFAVQEKTTQLIQRKVHYYDLSPSEREQNEEMQDRWDEQIKDFGDELVSQEKKLDGRVVNIKTLDIMLTDLMENGLKVESGDKIGKTIIFAKSHYEAENIVARFNVLYPEKKDFCKLIDSFIEDPLQLIDQFTERNNLPQIAVTVSLLDTGIDVPDILNLVFFKAVSSKIKFLQMIGRGTRLSKDIYGPGIDKNGFYVFDYYDNFSYFSQKGNWESTVGDKADSKRKTTPTTNCYQSLLAIAHYFYLRRYTYDIPKADEIKKLLYDRVVHLSNDAIGVQNNMTYVQKYRDINNWDLVDKDTIEEIRNKILPLFPTFDGTPKQRLLNECFYRMECRSLEGKKSITQLSEKFLKYICKALLEIKNIPAVVKKHDKIELLRKNLDNNSFKQNASYEDLEEFRTDLISITDFVDFPTYIYLFDLDDELIDEKIEVDVKDDALKNLDDYINKGGIYIEKIRNLEKFSKDEYEDFIDDLECNFIYLDEIREDKDPLIFIRSKVGINDTAIEREFGSFLNNYTLTLEQLGYCWNVINYTRVNGFFDPRVLQIESEFSDNYECFEQDNSYLQILINTLNDKVLIDNSK